MPKAIMILIATICVTSLAGAQAPAGKHSIAKEPRAVGADNAQAEIKDTSGRLVGRANLTQTADGVRIQTTLSGLPTGIHGFHIHETGRCDPPFETAGGHFNPEPKQHGKENRMGRHAGDLPNLVVPENGRVLVDVVEPMVSLHTGANSLMDSDGSALVVHQRGDDNRTDPDGNAGSRIACGVIMK
ncbi:MAG TPA: superoxide dismutase family protein [Vicinamibacterales bacterium]